MSVFFYSYIKKIYKAGCFEEAVKNQYKMYIEWIIKNYKLIIKDVFFF